MRYKSVEVQVPAKVNLQLSVGPKESDGYHEVVTVFQAISMMDTVKVTDASEFAISIAGDYVNGVPLDGDNLVARAGGIFWHVRKTFCCRNFCSTHF